MRSSDSPCRSPRSPPILRGSFLAPKRAISASPAPEAPRMWTQCGLTCRGIGAKYLRLRPQLNRGTRSCEPHLKAEHMAAPTHAANVKKALANSEPSTHGTQLPWTCATACPQLAKADTYSASVGHPTEPCLALPQRRSPVRLRPSTRPICRSRRRRLRPRRHTCPCPVGILGSRA